MSLDIVPYSASELGRLLNKHSHKGEGRSQAKSHLSYLDEYFSTVGARTIAVEGNYTDRDYIEDYAAYYARCHEAYQKECTRLHFFSADFDATLIDRCLANDRSSVRRLQRSYLGFIVIKPLPATIIGRTCLVTYGNRGRRRRFPTTRQYKAHVLGMEFEVDFLAFQEQDTDVAACATSALWSVFHATGHRFQHHIPTPAEITESAATHQRPFSRTLPAADGLTAVQIADAIRSVGLEPLALNAADLNMLRIAAYAYMRAGIPSLLLGTMGHGSPVFTPIDGGGHAIAVTGYSVPAGPAEPLNPTGCLFRAAAIQRLYAHDDQVGPFAKLRFGYPNVIGTSWVDRGSMTPGSVYIKPELLLLPLYHKIRVPIDLIVTAIQAFDDWIEMARAAGLLPLSARVQWDLYLDHLDSFKAEVFSDGAMPAAFRHEILNSNMPRFLWRAVAFDRTARQFELIFDATDLVQGNHFLMGIPFGAVCRAIGVFTSDPAIQNYIQSVGPRSASRSALWFSANTTRF